MRTHFNHIHYTHIGEQGPWLIFLHGFCERAVLWDNVLPDNQKYNILLVDIPGFGDSKDCCFDNLTDIALALKGLFDHLKINEPIVFGHSMGGYIALEMIKQGHIAPKALGMIHATFGADNELKKENRLKTIAFLQNNPLEAFLKVFTAGLFAPQNSTNEHFLSSAAQLVANNNKDCVIAALKAMMVRKDSYDWLAQTHLPILVLAGRDDAQIPVTLSIKEASLCRRGSLIILDDCGHLGQVEQPEATRKAIADFILWATLAQQG